MIITDRLRYCTASDHHKRCDWLRGDAHFDAHSCIQFVVTASGALQCRLQQCGWHRNLIGLANILLWAEAAGGEKNEFSAHKFLWKKFSNFREQKMIFWFWELQNWRENYLWLAMMHIIKDIWYPGGNHLNLRKQHTVTSKFFDHWYHVHSYAHAHSNGLRLEIKATQCFESSRLDGRVCYFWKRAAHFFGSSTGYTVSCFIDCLVDCFVGCSFSCFFGCSTGCFFGYFSAFSSAASLTV